MRRPLAAAVVLAASLALTGCGSPQPEQQAPAPADTPTAQEQSPADDTAAAVDHNDDDVRFMQMMIEHHEGALEMSELALEQADDQEVRDLAQRIYDAQGPEIEQMTAWLEERDQPTDAPTDGHEMGHMDHETMQMNGLTQEEVMAMLTDLDGAEFDQQFLESMIAHHRGAVVMSADVQQNGQNEETDALAQQIIDTQEAEMREMEQLEDRY